MNKTFGRGRTLRSVHDAQDFVERNGNSLSELLNVIGGDAGLDLFCDARRLLEGIDPDPVQVGEAIRQMRDILEQSYARGARDDAPLRWHGARLSDLAARLPA